MMHAKIRIALASDATDRLTPELIQSAERCQETYLAMLPHGSPVRGRLVKGERGHGWYHCTKTGNTTNALTRLDAEMVQLRNAGLSEADMLRIEQHVRETRERLYAGKPLRTIDELDRAEDQAEARENTCSLEARIHPSPVTYRELAEASRAEAAIETERAHVYDLTAARMEREALRRPMPRIPA